MSTVEQQEQFAKQHYPRANTKKKCSRSKSSSPRLISFFIVPLKAIVCPSPVPTALLHPPTLIPPAHDSSPPSSSTTDSPGPTSPARTTERSESFVADPNYRPPGAPTHDWSDDRSDVFSLKSKAVSKAGWTETASISEDTETSFMRSSVYMWWSDKHVMYSVLLVWEWNSCWGQGVCLSGEGGFVSELGGAMACQRVGT